MKLPSIQQVVRDSSRTFLRFPFVLFSAAIGTISAVILIDYEGPPGPTVLFNVLMAAILGIPLFTALALTTEKRKWTTSISIIVQTIGVLILVAYGFMVPSDLADAPAIHILRLLMIAIAFHFLVAVAPYISAGEPKGFWHYNKTLLLRILTALLYSVVLYAGLSIALAALDHLFGMNVPGKRYGELSILINGLFTTWFFLAGIPENLDNLDASTEYPKGIKVFARYILFPLVLVYLAILYAYVAKILLAWDWPQGWVSRLILGFSTTGVLFHLLLYPIRDSVENVWIRTFSRWFYIFMIPLVFMLLLAVWRRISEYGVTEGRYIALALGIWLVAIVAYFITSKTKSLKVIPGSLCILSLIVSFGSWGAFNISETSQVARLKELLVKTSILVEGTVQKPQTKVPFEETKQISSIIGYLHDVHGYERIQPWFRESLRKDSAANRLAYKEPAYVAGIMGIEYVRIWQGGGANEIWLNADDEGVINVGSYDRMLRVQHIAEGRMNKDFSGEDIAYKVNRRLDTLTLMQMRDGKAEDSLQIDLRQLIERLLKDYGYTNASNIPPERMSTSEIRGRMKAKVFLRHVYARREGSEINPISYDAEILYSIAR